MSTIDVSDLNLHGLILALWKNMKPAAFFRFAPSALIPSEPSREEIDQALKSKYGIDYLGGRCIKTNFSDLTKVDTRLYNRDAGEGAFERIVAQLRS